MPYGDYYGLDNELDDDPGDYGMTGPPEPYRQQGPPDPYQYAGPSQPPPDFAPQGGQPDASDPFTQADGLRLQKLQNGLSNVRRQLDDGDIHPEDAARYEAIINAQIQPLTQRQKADQTKQINDQFELVQQQTAHQEAIQQANGAFRANGLHDLIVPFHNVMTGDTVHFVQRKPGEWDQIDWSKAAERKDEPEVMGPPDQTYEEREGVTMPPPEQAGPPEPYEPMGPPEPQAGPPDRTYGESPQKSAQAKKPEEMSVEELVRAGYLTGDGSQGSPFQWTGKKPAAPVQKPWEQDHEGRAKGGFEPTIAQRRLQEVLKQEDRSPGWVAKHRNQVAGIYQEAVRDSEAQQRGYARDHGVTEAEKQQIDQDAWRTYGRMQPGVHRDVAMATYRDHRLSALERSKQAEVRADTQRQVQEKKQKEMMDRHNTPTGNALLRQQQRSAVLDDPKHVIQRRDHYMKELAAEKKELAAEGKPLPDYLKDPDAMDAEITDRIGRENRVANPSVRTAPPAAAAVKNLVGQIGTTGEGPDARINILKATPAQREGLKQAAKNPARYGISPDNAKHILEQIEDVEHRKKMDAAARPGSKPLTSGPVEAGIVNYAPGIARAGQYAASEAGIVRDRVSGDLRRLGAFGQRAIGEPEEEAPWWEKILQGIMGK